MDEKELAKKIADMVDSYIRVNGKYGYESFDRIVMIESELDVLFEDLKYEITKEALNGFMQKDDKKND